MGIQSHRKQRIRREFKERTKRFSLVFAFVFGVSWGFFWLPWLRISQINADDFVSKSEVESAVNPYLASLNAFWLPNNNFFLLQTAKLENVLKEKGIGLAVAQKAFPKTLNIKFPQTEPWLIHCGSMDCFYVSETGFLADRAPKFSESPIPQIITGNSNAKIGDGVVSPSEALTLRKVFQKMKRLNISVTSASFGKNAEVKIITNENWYLLILENSDIEKVFGDLKLLMDQKIKEDRARLEYIDMRYENKAFYKLGSRLDSV
ncbi:MAG: hypothetical protein Q7S12_03700 [bacterium]|nr:hypothetical protein [bacterium]